MLEATKYRYILNLLALGLMVSEKKIFLMFFSYIALYIHMTPWGLASLEPRGLIGRIYVGNYKTLLHTQYISCGPHVFR